mmetsp:Transcript_1243/g.2104  ORF Transcript_1243/g.2104 Transcript_1243/m.2104 type:complete len:647 (+) Transcript_1243:343-2283(+)
MKIVNMQTNTYSTVGGLSLLFFYVVVPLFALWKLIKASKAALMEDVSDISNYRKVVEDHPKKFQSELESIFANNESNEDVSKNAVLYPVVQILVGSFEEKYAWWKLVLMFERAALAIAIFSGAPPIVACVIVGVGWLANIVAQPYLNPAEDRTDLLARTTTLVTVVFAFLVEIGTVKEDEAWLALVLNSLSLFTLVVLLLSIGPVRAIRSVISWVRERRRAGKFAGGQRAVDKMSEADVADMSTEEFDGLSQEIKNMLAVKFASTNPMIKKWQSINAEMSEFDFKILKKAAEVFGKDESFVIETMNKKLIKTSAKKVTEINWSEQGLKGVIPYQLSSLEALRRIDLSGNEISPTKAKEVLDLQAKLGSNFVIDTKDKITAMIAWEQLGGEREKLENGAGSVKYSNWHGVTVDSGYVTALDWRNCGFEGDIPDELVNLPNLQTIDLRGNKLITARMSPLIEGLKNKLGSRFQYDDPTTEQDKMVLKVCFLCLGGSEDTLKNSSEDIKDWRGVKLNSSKRVSSIHWAGLNLAGTIPAHFEQLNALEYLNLQHNKLVFKIPRELGNLKNLKELYLNSNRLTDSIDASIGDLENLKTLDLSNNQLSGEIPKELSKLTKLEKANLMGNRFDNIVPEVKQFKDRMGEERFWL